MTKQVEEDKRSQRKRTADELLDEELDKGKVSWNELSEILFLLFFDNFFFALFR